MKFLIDTNVFIPLEPTRLEDRESLTSATISLVRLAMEAGHQLFVHPASRIDIHNDNNKDRCELRKIQLDKYPSLPNPPLVSSELKSLIGNPPFKSNDWVDNQLIAALSADAIDFLITEDIRLRKKVRRIGLVKRVISITEAISLIIDLSEKDIKPPPAVHNVKTHILDYNDPIFESLCEDYTNFNEWLQKCKREHRTSFIIKGTKGNLAAFCIINPEKFPPNILNGKVIKLCSFKVSQEYNGFRFGELMLKALFEYIYENQYDWIFVTVFEKYGKLIELFEDFGFQILNQKTKLGELILAKPLNPNTINDVSRNDNLNNLEYHIKYGPRYFRTKNVSWYLVPIKPLYTELLFPESRKQMFIFPGRYPFGNAIRKAYLCNSLTRSISPGSVLLFYRSQIKRGIVALGIVEETIVSNSSIDIVKTVGKRTVYSLDEIEKMCRRPVLAILFRQTRILHNPIKLDELIKNRIFEYPPQSIMHLKRGQKWLESRIAIK